MLDKTTLTWIIDRMTPVPAQAHNMRRPVVRADAPYRIVSVPNGWWRLQLRVAVEGTRTQDCWADMSPRMSFADALARLSVIA